MATGWLRGTVKEVVSGDTLVIMGPPRGGPPPEKRLTLASLIAPRMARRDGSTADEPFAWQSREFLRQKSIGQSCTFKVDYTLENVPGREFGSVFLTEKTENLAVAVVSAGWSKIRSAGGQQSPYYAELEAAQSSAESSGLGLWSKDESAIRNSVRTVHTVSEDGLDAQSILHKFGKGKPIPAIIEAVSSGASLRATLLPDQYFVSVMLVGIVCPSFNRRPTGQSAAAPAINGHAPGQNAEASESVEPATNGTAGAEAAAQPEPFAREAKFLSESKALGRDVRVMLEGVDKFGNLFGQVMYSDGSQPVSLGESLVKAGYAKLVNWGLEMMSTGGFNLREAERSAKQQRSGIWRNYVAPATAGTKLSDKFTGVVCEVVSGDCLVVRDAANGQERRVNLSSIRAPRLGRKGEKPEDWATEAKEFLRARLIGKEVSVNMEYNRQVAVGGAIAAEAAKAKGTTADQRDMAFATVTINEKDNNGQQKANNVAELLLIRGLAQIVRHRTDDERSAHYESLMNAESSGKNAKKGVHNKTKEPPAHHYNDVSLPGMAPKAKQYLPFFQRGKHTAIVEFVLSGHRLKLYIPKEGVCIAFSPSGVRAPQRATQGQQGRPAAQAEPFSEEAFAFTRQHCLQREIEVEIETMDRGGTFLGTLKLPGGNRPFNLGPALLEAGLAKLHPSFDPDRVQGGRELAAAQEHAQKARLKVWERYEPAAETATASGAEESANGHAAADSPRETLAVTVTEVVSGSEFYVQILDEPRLGYITDQLKSLSVSGSAPPQLQAGSLCLAQYSLDNEWYRASVQRIVSNDPVNPQYAVIFLDFGNTDRVGGKNIRPIDSALAAVPAQAHLCTLSHLKVPSLDSDYGLDAAQFVSQATGGGQRMSASIQRREKRQQQQGRGKDLFESQPLLHVVLAKDGAAAAESVNADLLRAGLARVKLAKRGKTDELQEVFTGCEEEARKGHTGIWIHGDPGSESDEDEAPQKPAWGRR